MKSRIIALIGIVFTIYGLVLCMNSNLNLGVVLVAVLGIVILCIGLFYSKLEALASMKLFKICKILFILFLSAEVVLVSFLAIYAFNDNVDYSEDAVIVLG